MPYRPSVPSSPSSRSPALEHTAWDAALRPAQQRAKLERARLEQRIPERAPARDPRLPFLVALANALATLVGVYRY